MRTLSRFMVVGALTSCTPSAPADRSTAAPDASVSYEDGQAESGGAIADAGLPADAFNEPLLDAPPRASYENPVISHDFPDPFVLRVGAVYYAYATNAFGKNVQIARSTDLVTWTDLPDALPVLPAWAGANESLTWAPSVLARSGTYVLYYSAHDNGSGFQCISRAVASAPEGPYVDTSSVPLVCQTSLCGSIDPSPFVDSDGSLSLQWKSDENNPTCDTSPRIWSQPMAADGVSLIGSPTALLVRDQLWEGAVIEGPSMVKSAGSYYLFYSANDYASADYSVGYGLCQSAAGPCQKMTLDEADGGSPAVLQSAGPALGPGGEAFFDDGHGRTWVAYHAWTAPMTSYSGGGARSLRIDPVEYTSGHPVIAGPTTTPQPL